MAPLHRYVYSFGPGHADGTAAMRDILGGKGAGLAEMTNLGVPVPPGFTISTQLCGQYLAERRFPAGLDAEVERHLKHLEKAAGKKLGTRGGANPLLVSVRSGAPVSMPGMMETILNLGLNDVTVQGLIEASNNPRFAYDSYRRFVQMYATVVHDLDKALFEARLDSWKARRKVQRDIDLDADDLKALVREFKDLVQSETGEEFPEDPRTQLWGAIKAVFDSWNTRRAIDYRHVHGIPDAMGTAVNVVAMVFGNMGEDSATGVAFTRDPATGERALYGEFLPNAQGEDVVAGIRDPLPLKELKRRMPEAYKALEAVAERLERHFADVQDLEFTIERGKLYLLQTRRAQRSGRASVRIAVEMVQEKLITQDEAVQRVPPNDVEQLLHPMVDPSAKRDVLATGLPASPGAAVGQAVFDADDAEELGRRGEAVILVRRETSPEDFHGMVQAKAILTTRGGMTSHAAVVARGMGKCCVVGAQDLDVDEKAGQFRANGRVVKHGEWITVDGSTGRVIAGKVPLVPPSVSGEFATLMSWADARRRLRVRANADTPADARRAREFGAEGIGLCRTEHMFFEGDRITAMREMILATDPEGRRRALAKILPMQRADFEGIFEAMPGLPVTIRLLDPPLHEFLPHGTEEVAAVAKEMKVPAATVKRLVESLHEANPMLGHRGCRLGISYPEITEVQAQAIFEAACRVVAKGGAKTIAEVMIPLVADVNELKRQAAIVRSVAQEVFHREGRAVPYMIGTMIELPRAALTADRIAEEAEFFSFGTNDLTQTTFGLSRDDAGRFLPFYVESGILEADPFQTLDQTGVGKLMEMAVRLGLEARPDLKLGICGEHGGDPASVKFCHHVGLNYVSCSPFRVPIARLAAAQAALEEAGGVDRTRATV
jgi:pyruvate, orthophosphate dikinase